jgi:hypothetical protein
MLTHCKLDEKVIPFVLPIHKELEETHFQVSHWEIKDWKSLEQRSHGPIFEAAGFKWYSA